LEYSFTRQLNKHNRKYNVRWIEYSANLGFMSLQFCQFSVVTKLFHPTSLLHFLLFVWRLSTHSHDPTILFDHTRIPPRNSLLDCLILLMKYSISLLLLIHIGIFTLDWIVYFSSSNFWSSCFIYLRVAKCCWFCRTSLFLKALLILYT